MTRRCLAATCLLLMGIACTDAEPSATLVTGNSATVVQEVPEPGGCTRRVTTDGDDADTGDEAHPWATLEHAAEAVPDDRCTVFVGDGTYEGSVSIDRSFETLTVFRAEHDYRARLHGDGSVLDIGGDARNLVFAGFEFTQSGPDAEGVLVYVSGSDDGSQAPSNLSFVNCVFHDSWGDDLLKIRSGAHAVAVVGNVFSNQSDQEQGEQHIDVNGVSDVTISDNVFFNDFGASGRPGTEVSQHFIVVKDSNGEADGVLGSRRITIERNVFAHFEGDRASFVAVGNDGEAFHEAQDVLIRNNLMLGDGPDEVSAALTISGAKDVSFVHNTVVGDLPSDQFAFSIGTKGDNPPNENVLIANSIWADPTGTMGPFSDGPRDATVGLTLERNLYWNATEPIDDGDLLGPSGDDGAVLADPGFPADPRDVVLPVWDGVRFTSGDRTIHEAFVRLVTAYGAIVAGSPAVDAADPRYAPPTDILGRPREGAADLGAVESFGT